MTYSPASGGEFDPVAWSSFLESTVIPSVRRGAVERGMMDIWNTLKRPSAEREALLSASKQFAPPSDMKGAGEIHAALMIMLALRANMPEMVSASRSAQTRYLAAATWICENLGEVIFWNCD